MTFFNTFFIHSLQFDGTAGQKLMVLLITLCSFDCKSLASIIINIEVGTQFHMPVCKIFICKVKLNDSARAVIDLFLKNAPIFTFN